MLIWILFACLTAAALAGVLWPAYRGSATLATRRDYDRAVFMDQLSELDRDLARGLIGQQEAEAARNEISRRLIAAAADTEPSAVTSGRGTALLAAAIAVPVVAGLLYMRTGAPNLPDVPLRERIALATQSNDFVAMVAQVENHLKQNPSDVQGWRVIAPAYKRMNRFEDAARAYERLIEIGGASPDDYADLGEMIVFGNEGMVTVVASKAFDEALKRDKAQPKARYYAALALRQEGKGNEAVLAWKALLDDSPADAPWRAMVDKEIAAVSAEAMTPEDRQAMIRGMVDGLEQRLKTDGSDLDGWRKLINARSVLGEMEKAKAAYEAARSLFNGKPEALASLDELARNLNIQ